MRKVARAREAEEIGRGDGSVVDRDDEHVPHRSARARDLALRETALAERWLTFRMGGEDRYFETRQQAKDFIKQHLLQFYSLRSASGG